MSQKFKTVVFWVGFFEPETYLTCFLAGSDFKVLVLGKNVLSLKQKLQPSKLNNAAASSRLRWSSVFASEWELSAVNDSNLCGQQQPGSLQVSVCSTPTRGGCWELAPC